MTAANMAHKKDMRRPDLSTHALYELQLVATPWMADRIAVIPYQEPVSKGDSQEFSSTIATTMPMAAIFMRNRFIGWYVCTRRILVWVG